LRRRAQALEISSLARERVSDDPVVRFTAPLLWYFDRLDDPSLPLDSACVHNARRYIYLRQALETVLIALAADGVPVILLKGIVLAEALYDDPVLRRTGDIDLLVQRSDLQRTVRCLEALGWRLKNADSAAEARRMMVPDYVAEDWQRGEWTFQDDAGISLDLHIHLVPSVWFRIGYTLAEDEIWAAAVPAAVFPELAHEMSGAHTLIYLCVHLARHGIAPLTGLLDVDQYVRRLTAGEAWNWDDFLACCERWHVRSAVYHAFDFCRWLYGTPLPDRVMDRLDPGAVARARVTSVLRPRHLVRDSGLSLGQRYPTLVKVALVERPADIGKMLKTTAFPNARWREVRYGKRVPIWRHWAHVVEVIAGGH
jgi:hypothetical protein